MNTVLVLQPEDVARLLEIDKGIQALLRERESILTKAARTEYVEPEHAPDVSMFKGTTRLLLMEYMLFPEDIRQDVMGLLPDDDETDADGSGLRKIIERARNNINKCPGFRYGIMSIKGKGYQLVDGVCDENITNRTKKRKKKAKKRHGTSR